MNDVSTQSKTAMRRLAAIVYYVCLCAFPLVLGGAAYLMMLDPPGPDAVSDAPDTSIHPAAAEMPVVIAGVALLIAVVFLSSGFVVCRGNLRRAVLGTVWCLCLVCGTVGLTEFLLRFTTPAWPVVGLHGVSPQVARSAWARSETAADAFNSWGQRDRERSVTKPTGGFRLAFIGDSFLEESTTDPIARLVEMQIGRPNVEVINLGVSATDPDEYFYRTANIATQLQVDHCVLFLYSGNDFSAPPRTLSTFAGIAAVYPRGSLLSSLGLYSLNHLLTNHRRPVLQAWFASGDLLAAETRFGEAIAAADDQRIRDLLYSMDHGQRTAFQNRTLASRLNAPETTSFFDALRNPDHGLFRSYYLSAALWSASVGGGQWRPQSVEPAWYWLEQTRRVCQKTGIGLTLVIIPEAFQVDERMIEQWLPLTDMRTLTASCRDASERLAARAVQDGFQVIDLHAAFAGSRGTYLNPDGHWSASGTELAANIVTKWIEQQILSELQ